MPDDVMDQQDPQQAAPAPAPGDQLTQLLGLLAQARSQPVPVQQAPLPQVLGPATGTPSNQPKTLNDFLPQQAPQAPSSPASTSPDHPDNASTADVALHGAAQREHNPLIDHPTLGWFKQQFNQKGSDYYVSPARRILQDFMIGLSGLTGQTQTSYQQKYQEWQTDLKNAMEEQGKDIQQQRADDINTRAQNRLAQQQQLAEDRKTLSDRDYALKHGHTVFEEQLAQKKLDLAVQVEKDRVTGKAQSLALAAMPKAMRQAQAEVQLQHRNAGEDLNDPGVQAQMNVEIARRMEELQPQVHASDVWQKMGESGALDGVDVTDLGQVQNAINKADIGKDDKAFLKGWVASHNTPASLNQSGVNRSAAYANNRLYPSLTTDTGNITYASGSDIKNNPGGFAPVSPSVKAMGQSAQFDEVTRSMNQLRSAWHAVGAQGPIDTALRGKLIYALDQSDQGKFDQFMHSKVYENMTDVEKDLVIATNSANENIMALRNIAGMGQGASDLRDAIRKILPSGATPDVEFADKQLDTIMQQINALHNIPQVGTSGLTSPNPPRGTAAQFNNATGLKDVTTNQFRHFAEPEDSILASVDDINIKIKRNPNLTISQLVPTWIGKGLPQGYSAENVAKALGVSRNAKVATVGPENVVRAMAKFETGYQKSAASKDRLRVFNPAGKSGFIDADQWDKAQKLGYRKR